MKSIENKAEEFIKSDDCHADVNIYGKMVLAEVIDAFKAGFHSAFEWINSDEYQPKEDTPVLVETEFNGYTTAVWCKDYWICVDGDMCDTILKWKYIELEDYINHFKV